MATLISPDQPFIDSKGRMVNTKLIYDVFITTRGIMPTIYYYECSYVDGKRRVTKEVLDSYIPKEDNNNLILVYDFFSDGKPIETSYPYNIFHGDEIVLLYSCKDQPSSRILSIDELNAIESKAHKVKISYIPSQLPKLLSTDISARILNYKPGMIIAYNRTNGERYYRLVVPPS